MVWNIGVFDYYLWNISLSNFFFFKNVDMFVMMDGVCWEICGGGLYVVDGVIQQVGLNFGLLEIVDMVIDVLGQIVLLGFVNIYYYFNQMFMCNFLVVQNNNLFLWLKVYYWIWVNIDLVVLWVSMLIGLVELVLFGCMMVFDYIYFFQSGNKVDYQIEVVWDLGVCFYVSWGLMLFGESKGGLLLDVCVEDEVDILKDMVWVIDCYYDVFDGVMICVVVVFCLLFFVLEDFLWESVVFVWDKGVMLYIYLCEMLDEECYIKEWFGKWLVEWMEGFDWIGLDVWFVYVIYVDDNEIWLFVGIGCGVVYCLCLNMWLVLGIVLVKKYMVVGVKVGFGVDGFVSNDGLNMLNEVCQVMLFVWLEFGLQLQDGFSEYVLLLLVYLLWVGEWMIVCEVLELVMFGGVVVFG